MNIPGHFAKTKCPCCNNPWSETNENQTLVCAPCLSDSKGYTGIDPANFDNSQSPKENFYQWSNGGWRSKNPIPSDYPSWNTFIQLRDINLQRIKDILEVRISKKYSLILASITSTITLGVAIRNPVW